MKSYNQNVIYKDVTPVDFANYEIQSSIKFNFRPPWELRNNGQEWSIWHQLPDEKGYLWDRCIVDGIDSKDEAVLIAAAPDLLEALEGMVEMVEMNGFGKEAMMDIARAAINKARNEK